MTLMFHITNKSIGSMLRYTAPFVYDSYVTLHCYSYNISVCVSITLLHGVVHTIPYKAKKCLYWLNKRESTCNKGTIDTY